MPHEKGVGSNPFAQSLMTGLGTGIASKALSLFDKKEKPIRGKAAGQLQKKYYEGLYGDKLNPWEWQGHSGEGGVSAPVATGQQARNTLQEKQNVDIAMQSAQLKNNIEVAKIGAGLTPKTKIPQGSKQETQINQIIQDTKLAKTKTDILRTAKSLSDEAQAIMDTLKGNQGTMLKKAQDTYIAAMTNAQGNLNLMKKHALKFGNYIKIFLQKTGKLLKDGSEDWADFYDPQDKDTWDKKTPFKSSIPRN